MLPRRAAVVRTTTNAFFAFCIFLAASAGILFAHSSSVSAAPPPFLTNYQLNDRSEDIRSLQEVLNAQGFVVAQSGAGSIGNETPLFGLHTYGALIGFQSAHGLPSTGFFGPLTRAVSNLSYSTSTSLQNVQSIVSPTATSTIGSTTLPSSTPLPGYAPGQLIFGGGGPPPPTCTISASPTNISIGSSTVLTWTSNNASSASINQSIGSVSLTGSQSVSPTTNSTYILTVANSQGSTASCSANTSATETTSPSVVLTAPSAGTTIGGTSVTLTATSSDIVGVAGVQFKVDGANVGASGTTSPYSISWNSTSVADGSHTIAAVAHNAVGNYATSSITITVRNSPPVISSIVANSISSSTEAITWTTDEAASSAINFGGTTSYGSASSSATLVTLHSITLTGLTASTTYDFQVSSADGQGNIATSSNQTFTTAAYNYYVDSVNGSDANTGTSPASAFRNLTALPTINSGQSVGLAAGSYWRQTLAIGTGSPLVNNVTVAMYGTGSKPVLDGADIISTGDWSKTGGFTNLYQATEPLPGSTNWVNVFENGSFLQNVASQATADATACSYYISDMTLTGAPIYIHTCDGSNPASNGKTYEYTHRSLVLQVWGNNETISNISTKRAAGNNGSLVVLGDGSASYIQGCTADLGGKHNLFAPGGSTVDGCSFTDEYYPSSGNMLVFFDGVGSGLPVTVKNSTFLQTQNITGNVVSAIFTHTGSGSLGAMTVSTSTMAATNGSKLSGIGGTNLSSLSINDVIASSTANLVSASVNTTLTNSQMVSSYTTTTALIGTAASNITVTVSNTQACLNNIQNGIVVAQNASTSITLAGNTFYVGATQGFPYDVFRSISGSSTLIANNNVLDSGKASAYAWDFGSQTGVSYTGNNNSYALPNLTRWILGGTTYTSFAAWQTASGQDSNSTTAGSGISACTLRSP